MQQHRANRKFQACCIIAVRLLEDRLLIASQQCLKGCNHLSNVDLHRSEHPIPPDIAAMHHLGLALTRIRLGSHGDSAQPMNASLPHAQQTWHPRCKQGQAAEHSRSQSTVRHRDHARQDSRLPGCHSSSAENSLQLNQAADQQHLEPNQNGAIPPLAEPRGSRQAQALVQLQSRLAMMQTEKQRRRKLWMAAIKPPMYTVAYVPILVRCPVGSLLCRL